MRHFLKKSAAAGFAAAVVLGAAVAQAAEFRVPADYPTIQSAINAAAALPEASIVKVRSGHYHEHVSIHDLTTGDRLTIMGSWNAAYDAHNIPASDSIVDGGGVGPVVKITGDNKRQIYFQGFTVIGGSTSERWGSAPAGGVYVDVSGGSQVRFDEDVIKDHRFRGRDGEGAAVRMIVRDSSTVTFRKSTVLNNDLTAAAASGAGMRAVVRGSGSLILELNRFLGNRVRATDRRQLAAAAGADLHVFDQGRLGLGRNEFSGNVASGAGAARYAALIISADGGAYTGAGRDVFANNRTESDCGDASGTALLAVSSASCHGGPRISASAREWAFRGNVVGRHGHVLGVTSDAADATLTDTLIAKSPGEGLFASGASGAKIYATNLTIADSAGRAVRVASSSTGATTYLSNSILFGNGANAPAGSPVQTANLVGINPLFVNAAGGDYHLQPGSLAIDAGNATPPGDLGFSDLDHLGRVEGAGVDIGAYERQPAP